MTQSPSSKVEVRLVSTTCGLAGVTGSCVTDVELVTQRISVKKIVLILRRILDILEIAFQHHVSKATWETEQKTVKLC